MDLGVQTLNSLTVILSGGTAKLRKVESTGGEILVAILQL